MTAKAHILLAEGANSPFKPSGTPHALFQPPHPMEFGAYADEVTWILSVAGVTGAPTAWSLGAKFQYCLPHTTGNQYRNPVWFDLQPENVETNIIEGVGWYGGANAPPVDGGYGIIASNADFTGRVTVQRTIKHTGLLHRVRFDLSMTGGTDPGALVTLVAIPKGA